MKKLLLLALFVPMMALAQTVPTIAALEAATSTTLPQSQADVLSYATIGDGGGGNFSVGTTTTANGCTIFNDASGRSWYREDYTNKVNVRWCGAVGNGVTLDTTAFVNAVSIGKKVYAPSGNYLVADGSVVLGFGQELEGDGRAEYVYTGYTGAGTLITCTNRTGHSCISVAAGINWVTIRNLTIAGAGTLGGIAAGNSGLAFLGDCNYCKIDGIEVYNHYNGIVLAGSIFGWIQNVASLNNSSNGILEENTTATSTQWQYTNVLSQNNGGDGIEIASQAVGGAVQNTLGAMVNVATFANSGAGLAVVGSSAVPIYDLRMSSSFLGQDGNTEIYLQPFGGNINITGTQIELSGTSPTGPTNSTPKSNIGFGIQTLNGSGYTINGNWINANSNAGVSNTATGVNITGNTITNNGESGTNAYGIQNNPGGSLDMNSNTIQGHPVGVINSGTINVEVGNNIKPNTTTYYGAPATIGGSTVNNQ